MNKVQNLLIVAIIMVVAISVQGKKHNKADRINITLDSIYFNDEAVISLKDAEGVPRSKGIPTLRKLIESKKLESKLVITSHDHVLVKILFRIFATIENVGYVSAKLDNIDIVLKKDKVKNSEQLRTYLSESAVTFGIGKKFLSSVFYTTAYYSIKNNRLQFVYSEDCTLKFYVSTRSGDLDVEQIHTNDGKLVANKFYKSVYKVSKNDRVYHLPNIRKKHKIRSVDKYHFNKVRLFDQCRLRLLMLKKKYPKKKNLMIVSDLNVEYIQLLKMSNLANDLGFKITYNTFRGNGESNSEKKYRKLKIRRTTSSVMKIVKKNVQILQRVYYKRLKEKAGLKGKIITTFTISKTGKTLSCKIRKSEMNDPNFEKTVISEILKWDFGKIENGKDSTEVNYPFIFKE